MKTYWTNETYANWLKDNGVAEDEFALVEYKWNGSHRLPHKVHGKSVDRNDIKLPKGDNKTWYAYLRYSKLSTGYSIGGSQEFQIAPLVNRRLRKLANKIDGKVK